MNSTLSRPGALHGRGIASGFPVLLALLAAAQCCLGRTLDGEKKDGSPSGNGNRQPASQPPPRDSATQSSVSSSSVSSSAALRPDFAPTQGEIANAMRNRRLPESNLGGRGRVLLQDPAKRDARSRYGTPSGAPRSEGARVANSSSVSSVERSDPAAQPSATDAQPSSSVAGPGDQYQDLRLLNMLSRANQSQVQAPGTYEAAELQPPELGVIERAMLELLDAFNHLESAVSQNASRLTDQNRRDLEGVGQRIVTLISMGRGVYDAPILRRGGESNNAPEKGKEAEKDSKPEDSKDSKGPDKLEEDPGQI